MNRQKPLNNHVEADGEKKTVFGGTVTSFHMSPMVKSEQLQGDDAAKLVSEKPHNRKPRQIWSHEEDIVLQRIVDKHKFDETHKNHWAQIADKMNKKKTKNNQRTGKQCRDRYHNHLRSNIKKGGWTREEEHQIREMHKAFGTKWSCMAKLMKNRTDNDIKNKWYSMVRSEKKARTRLQSVHGFLGTQPFTVVHTSQEDPSIRAAGVDPRLFNQDGTCENQGIVSSHDFEKAAQGLVEWQEGDAVYGLLPYNENGPEFRSSDLFLISRAPTSESRFNATSGHPYNQIANGQFNCQPPLDSSRSPVDATGDVGADRSDVKKEAIILANTSGDVGADRSVAKKGAMILANTDCLEDSLKMAAMDIDDEGATSVALEHNEFSNKKGGAVSYVSKKLVNVIKSEYDSNQH